MASGNTLSVFYPNDSEPPNSGFAILNIRNDHPVLDFGDVSNNAVMFTGFMPRYYAGNGITTTILWCASGTTGLPVWGIELERLGTADIDIDADSFSTLNVASGVTNGTDGVLTSTTIEHTSGTQMDDVNGGDFFRIKLWRRATDNRDTISNNTQFLGMEIKET